ncbi:MAG: hypothetical protein KatS3mg121_0309 [Gammaproteobacteria bacterium]|nr:MAG: hypothetical protein KatS3mg121_0309 [Gammaproteobacteria bacterium]
MVAELGDRVKRGFAWTLAGRGGQQLVSFGFGIALARLLEPADFGLIAACLLFLEVGSTLAAAAWVRALVRRPELDEATLGVALVWQALAALGACVLLWALAPGLAGALGQAALAGVLAVLALNLLWLPLQGPAQVRLQRRLDFSAIAAAGVVEVLAFGLTAVAGALAGWGVWALVTGRIAGRGAATAVLWRCGGAPPRPRLAPAPALFASAWRFAAKETLDDVSKNLAYLLVGWTQGVAALGLYSRAHHLMTLPVDRLAKSLELVLYPAFAGLQAAPPARLRAAFLKANCLMAVLAVPALVGLALVAPLLVPALYGEKWAPAAAPLQWLCLGGVCYALEAPAVALINALGLLGSEIRRQLLHIALVAAAVAAAAWLDAGLVGVAAGVSGAALVYAALLVWLLGRRIDLPWRNYLQSLWPACAAAAAMAAAVGAWRHWGALLGGGIWPLLLGAVALGALVYGGVMALFAWWRPDALCRPALEELRGVAGGLGRRLAAAVGR